MRGKLASNRVWPYFYAIVLITLIVIAMPAVRRFFLNTGWRWFYILIISFSFSYCLTPAFRWVALKKEILDAPDSRKVHHEATPLLGGGAVFIGFVAAILINGIYSLKLWVILAASALLFIVGIVDDYREISAGKKLLAQLVCTTFVMAFGIVLKVIPDSLGIFSIISNHLLTIFWIIGITNAMNFFDGMDGLAAGLGSIISFFLGIVAFQTNQPFLGWISVAMMGCCIGFLPYNFRMKGRALIFLGDAGSTVIGFILACVAVYGEWSQTSPMVALASPLLIFWILIFDMIHISVDRILTGKVLNLRQWVEYVGKDHFHHRIAAVLGSRKRSVLFVYLLTCCLGFSAVLLRNADPLDALLLLIQASLIVMLITLLERYGRSLNGGDSSK